MARSFNGTTDKITTSSVNMTGVTDFSWAAWIYITGGAGSIRCIIRNKSGTGSDSVRGLYLNSNDKFDAVKFDGNIVDSTSTPSLNTWTHVGLSYSTGSGNFSFFVNGSAAGTAANGGATDNSPTSAILIGDDGFGQAFPGRIADVAFWDNAALTASDFAALASGVRAYRIRRNKLVGYWPLEGTASPEPDVINGSDGTLTGTSQVANPFNYTTPKYGSRSFNGASDKIVVGNVAALQPSGAFSFAGWVNPTDFANSYASPFNDYSGGGAGIFVRTDAKIAAYVGGGNIDPSTDTLSAGVWAHIAFTANSALTEGRLYLNAVSQGTESVGSVSWPGNFQIGNVGVGGTFFKGQVADVAFWNTQLSSNEVAKLYAGFRPHQVRLSGLVGYWPLEGTASPEPDMIAGNNGTLTGTSAGASPTRYQDVVGA